jgi:mRNA interferase MazF
MPSYSKDEIVLVRYPFSDLSASKIRPAIIVGQLDRSSDYLIVPLTSRTAHLATGEFILKKWQEAGLNVASAVKQGIYTINARLIVKSVGYLSTEDSKQVEQSLRQWLGLP